MKKATVRRTLSALLALAMVMSLFTTAIAAEPADAAEEDTSIAAIEEDGVQSGENINGEIIDDEESGSGQLAQPEDADEVETTDADAVAIEDDEPYVELSEDYGAYDSAVLAEDSNWLRSSNGYIEFLPSLAKGETSGSQTGLVAEGGFTIDINWEDSTLKQVKIVSNEGNDCKILKNGATRWENKAVYQKLGDGSFKRIGRYYQDSMDWTCLTFKTEAGGEYYLVEEANAPVINDADSSITWNNFSYHGDRDFGAYCMDAHFADQADSSFEFTFEGTGVDIMAEVAQGDNNVELELTVDGEPVDQINYGYSATADGNRHMQQIIASVSGLADEQHTISGRKMTGNCYLVIDGFSIHKKDVDTTLTTGYFMNNTDPRIKINNFQGLSSQRKHGDFSRDVWYTYNEGGSIEFTFIGTGFDIMGEKHNQTADLNVYVDGASDPITLTPSQGEQGYRYARSLGKVDGLEYGEHNVRIDVDVAGGKFIEFDGVMVHGQNFTFVDDIDPAILYTSNWQSFGNRNDNLGEYGATLKYNDSADESTIEYTFTGTGIDAMFTISPDSSGVRAYIDDQLDKEVDISALSGGGTIRNTIGYSVDGLTYGQHTIKLEKMYSEGHTVLAFEGFIVKSNEEYATAQPTATPGATEVPAAEPTAEAETNVMLNKKAISYTSDSSGYEITKINDGDMGTRWAQTPGTANQQQEIVFDLGAEYDITKVVTAFELPLDWGRYNYKIEYSLDNSDWDVFVDNMDAETQSQTVTDTGNFKARYIRLTANQKDFGASIYEFEVYGTLASGAVETTNVLEGKTVTSYTSDSAGYEIAKINDGDMGSRWAQTGGTQNQTQEIVFDLGAEYDISRTYIAFELSPEAGYKGYNYKIEYSTDNQEWDTFVDKLAEYTTTQNVEDTGEFTARYIKLTVNNEDWGASIYEIEAYGVLSEGGTATAEPAPTATTEPPVGTEENAALNKPVTVTTEDLPNNPIANINDGNTNTRWAQKQGTPNQQQTIVFDLLAEYDITRSSIMFELAPGGDTHGYNYKIEYSMNNSEWTTLVDKLSEYTTTQTVEEDGDFTARYIRLTVNHDQWGASIWEFEAYGVKRAGTDATPAPSASPEPTAKPAPTQGPVDDSEADFFVSPNGDDSNDGKTKATAFKTITKAQEEVRKINDNMTKDIIVCIMDGEYTLDSTINFTPEDSGSNGYKVIYRAENGTAPIVSGGVDISTGWELYDESKGIYKKEGVDWSFRQLYTDTDKAIRAREPNMTNRITAGPYFRASGSNGQYPMQLGSERALLGANNGYAEMVWVSSWSQFRGRIENVDFADNGRVTFKSPENGFAWNHHTQGDTPYFLENSYSYLDAEGEWYLDKDTDTLYYIPREGEVMNQTRIIAPKVDTLVNIEGESEDNRVKDLTISGIRFLYANWTTPDEYGYCCVQGGFRYQTIAGETNSTIRGSARYEAPEAALQLKYTDGVTLEYNEFSYSGSWGVMGYEGTANTMIAYNVFRLNAGGGVALGMVDGRWDDREQDSDYGDPDYNDMEGQSVGDSIVHNTIDEVATEYKEMVGIGALLPQYITIAHNDVYNLPYTGINLGWNWSDVDHGMTHNMVYQNKIINTCMLLQDGGGIYTLGRMDGDSLFYYNYIKNVEMSEWAPWDNLMGIYFDNGSCYKKAQANVFDNTVYAFQAYNPPNHDNYFEGNYYNCPKGLSSIGSSSAKRNIPFTGDNIPEEAQRIIDAAGVGTEDLPMPESAYNLALGKTVTASSENPSYPAANIIDGDQTTRWEQADIPNKPDTSQDPTWVQVDLEDSYSITDMEIKFQYGNRCKYKIEYSNDGETWETYADRLSQEPSASELVYESKDGVTARYIRITMDSSGWGAGIYEIGVYTDQSMTPNSVIVPESGTFDKAESWQKDIDIKAIENGSKFKQITNGGYVLQEDVDYIRHWGDITLSSDYLETLPGGTTVLTVEFEEGPSRDFTVDVIDDDGSENVALNKPITASSVSMPAENMVDGDTTTRWAQQEGTPNQPSTINIDLKAVYDITGTSIMFELENGYNYKIEYSLDNMSYSTFVDKMNDTTTVQTCNDNGEFTARYIRITANHSQWGASIYEFMAKGKLSSTDPGETYENVILNKTATSYTSDSEGHEISMINDGNMSTRWAQALNTANQPQTIVFDLNGKYEIVGTNIAFELNPEIEGYKGYNYKIEYSEDGQTWTTFVDKLEEYTTVQNVEDGGEFVANYIRLTVNHEDFGASIYEFEVYGSEYTAPEPTAEPTVEPTAEPTTEPEPTAEPTAQPTSEPTEPEPTATTEPTVTAEPEPTATTEPTVTSDPTATTEPAATEEPGATEEPEPSASADPEATPTVDPTPEEVYENTVEYIEEKTAQNESLSGQVGDIANDDTISQEVKDNISKLFDEVTSKFDAVKEANDALKAALDNEGSTEEELERAADAVESAIEAYETAVDELNNAVNEQKPLYDISVQTTGSGTVNIDRTSAREGDTVSFSVSAGGGYRIGSVTLGYTALSGDSGNYEFTMPDRAVTIRVTFIRTTSSSGSGGSGWYTSYTDDSSGATPIPVATPDANGNMFSDIGDVEWAAEAINALAERGIINGTGGGMFEPNNYITREEFAKIAVGCLDIDVYSVSTIKFADVDTGEWYAPYVAAINNAGYMLGYSDTEFGVGRYITREEIATIVYRALRLNETAELTFSDADKISDYAKTPVAVLAGRGVINGYPDGEFKPHDLATRAEAAKLLYTAGI
ncbi:MAG TPA: discoidin domain-containing protein [Firmicutes bacterium]|nr:discoidin domain-containing protein [Bacillota bacterium]